MTETTAPKTMKAHCPRCDGERNCEVHGELDVSWHEDVGRNAVWGESQFRLLRCKGCEMVFHYARTKNSEDWDVEYNPVTGEERTILPWTVETYPTPTKEGRKPEWAWSIYKIDPQLQTIMADQTASTEPGRPRVILFDFNEEHRGRYGKMSKGSHHAVHDRSFEDDNLDELF